MKWFNDSAYNDVKSIMNKIRRKEEKYEDNHYIVSPKYGLMVVSAWRAQREIDALAAMDKQIDPTY